MLSSFTEFCLSRCCMQRIHNGSWLMVNSRNRFSCSSKCIHMPVYVSVAIQHKKLFGVIHHYVHCSLQLSLGLENFYLLIMKLYGLICNNALQGSRPFYKQIFFRLILISLLAHAFPINGNMISLTNTKTTAASSPLHTARGEFRLPKPQSSLWSP